MSIDLQQLLRLEIERDPDPGELLNLIPNPSGKSGAWGWATPVPGSILRADPTYGLVYTSPGAAASYFHSVPMEVNPGQYVAASWRAVSVFGRYAAKVEWLDASKAVLSTTAGTGNLSGGPGVVTYGAFLAPASTFYCRIRFDHFDAAGGNPPALSWMSVTDVTLTAADEAAALSVARVNLVTNPSAEGGTTTGWTCEGGTIGTTTAHTASGTRSFVVTKTGKRGALVARTTIAEVVPGRDYAPQVKALAGGPDRKVSIGFNWKNAAGKAIGRPIVGPWIFGTDWSAPLGVPLTAPTSAASADLELVFADVAAGGVRHFDEVMVEQASRVLPYFDGNTASSAGVTNAWTGAPHASTSTAVTSPGSVGTLAPIAFQNIMGPTAQITIDREDLNVGSMSVRLFDAVLDPTQSDLIRTGRRIRLVATTPDGPEVLFAGKVFTGSVAYHLLRADEGKRTEVTLTAVDPNNQVASTPQREGVARIADLPHVLEATGVPWSVNGDGNQVAAPEVVAYNDNASALDQVAVTRDSVLGYAWVDRNGVLQAWDADKIDTTVAAELDESTYTADLNIDFDLDSLINSVTVRVLRVIATTGATEEVVFGPYVDVESYRKRGEHAKEFTVQGFDAADTAAIQAYAQRILDANATPRLRVNSAVLPIAGPDTAEADVPIERALLDLYDRVTVTNARAGLVDDSRITRIHHEISATPRGGKWLVTLGFTSEGSVAPSTAVPSPPPSVGAVVAEARAEFATAARQTFSIDPPVVTDGFTEDHGWWQIVDGDVLGFWRLVGGVWVEQTIVTAEALYAKNALIDALNVIDLSAVNFDAVTITGATITGGVFKSSTNGQRVEISSGGAGKVTFHNNSGQVGYVGPGVGGLLLAGPGAGFAVLDGSDLVLYGGARFRYDSAPIADAGANAYISVDGSLHKGNSSAARYKENLRPVDLAADDVLDAIDLVLFDYREEYGGYPDKLGAIADHAVGTALENFVVFDSGEVENFDYGRAAFVLAHTVGRAQRQQIADLTARIEQLEAAPGAAGA